MRLLNKRQIYLSQDLEKAHLYDKELNLKFVWEKNLEKILHAQAVKLKELTDKAETNYLFMRRAVKNENPFMILAHELFDAIPVYQFIYDETLGWLEKVVDVDKRDSNLLTIRESEKPTENVKKLLQPEKRFNTEEIRKSLKTGDMIEISPHSQKIMTEITELTSLTKGCGLIIDYGEDQALTNSIRAIKQHKYLSESEMLKNPGKADISAYVDFNALKYASNKVEGSLTRGPMTQGLFLESMGMNMRKEILMKSVSQKPDSAKLSTFINADFNRLTHSDQMGEIYKFLFVGNKKIGEVYPFLEEALNKPVEYS